MGSGGRRVGSEGGGVGSGGGGAGLEGGGEAGIWAGVDGGCRVAGEMTLIV